MIKIKNLSKRFGDFQAVDNLSFELAPGEVVGFLGPNGAGKSTTMKMLTGFLPQSAGEIEVAGLNLDDAATEIKAMIGYLPEGAPAYGDMTPRQFLHFIADVRGLSGSDKPQRIKAVVDAVELHAVMDRQIDNLSKGYKRRVGLAQAIIHDPKVLILDEPTDGLDPNQKHQVRALIQNLAKDKIVIISTHILEEVTAVCNRAMIIAQGKLLFDGTPAMLEEKSRFHNAVTIDFTETVPEAEVLKGIQGVNQVDIQGKQVTLFADNAQSLYAQVYHKVVEAGWKIEAMYAEKGRLDDVFRDLTQQEVA